MRLASHVRQAFSLEIAVVAAQHLMEPSLPDFGEVRRYRAQGRDRKVCVVFPRPAMVFVIDELEQQTAQRLLVTQLPRPVPPEALFVSDERKAYVESRHGLPPQHKISKPFYFEGTTAGQVYTALVGREGTANLGVARASNHDGRNSRREHC
jgi:hypothetical protein